MVITKEQLSKALPHAFKSNIDKYYAALDSVMDHFNIDSKARMAMFLAQVAHESGSLKYVREIASGSAYDTGKLAKSLGNTPEADGDGQKYKGRGLIQLSGLYNYKLLSERTGIDFVNHPEKLEEPYNASYAAGWFWDIRKLNPYADRNTLPDFEHVTRVINGGLNGLADRLVRWSETKKALGL